MKKQFSIFFALFFTISGIAQINFEKGYFVKNDGERISCLIKNMNWKSNPNSIQYKVSEEGGIERIGIDSMQEFAINNASRYRRFTVQLDVSSNNLNNLSSTQKPELKEDTLLLKVLLEGKASLYYFENANLRRFFYTIADNPIEQLIYKKYQIGNGVKVNDSFKNQLWDKLRCKKLNKRSFDYLGYYKSDLLRVFSKYNECTNASFSVFEEKKKKIDISLSLRPGLNITSFEMSHPDIELFNADFGGKTTFRAGIEIAYFLPFNKKKWSIFVEPTYQYYKSSAENIQRLDLNYQSIELPFGIRHHFYLGDDSSITVHGLFHVSDWDFDSKIDFTVFSGLNVEASSSVGVGLGYSHKHRYVLELRYGFTRDLLASYLTRNSKYKTISIIIGFTIIK